MSRITYNDDGSGWSWIRWAGAAKQALHSKRGKAALQELREALLRLPTKALITDRLCDGKGVCVLGALAYRRAVDQGVEPREIWKSLQKPGAAVDADAKGLATWAVKNLSMTFTLAWELMEKNDERFGSITPEERYTAMLNWVEGTLAEPAIRRAA